MNPLKEKIQVLPKDKRLALLEKIKLNGESFGIYPLSTCQRRMLVIYNQDKSNSMYNVSFRICVKKAFSIETIKNVLTKIVLKHQMLRTKLIEIEGETFFSIEDGSELLIKAEENPAENIENIVLENEEKPFDLENEYGCRFLIIKTKSEIIVDFCIHHMFVDGQSINVIYRDFCDFCEETGESSNETSYLDFIKYEKSINREELELFWKNETKNCSSISEFPYSFLEKTEKSNESAFLNYKIEKAAELNEECKKLKISEFSFYLTAYALSLAKFCGQKSITVGIPVLNRNEQRFYNVVGYFSNTIPVCVNFVPDESYEQLLKRINKKVNDGIDKSGLSFDEIVQSSGIERKINKNPLFQAIFSMHSETLFGTDSSSQKEYELKMYGKDDQIQFEQLCTLKKDADSVEVVFGYEAERFSEEKEALLKNYFSEAISKLRNQKDKYYDFLENNAQNEEVRFYEFEKDILNAEKSIKEAVCLYAKDLLCVFYTAEKNIDEIKLKEKLFNKIETKVCFVELESLPLENGKADISCLYKILLKVKEKSENCSYKKYKVSLEKNYFKGFSEAEEKNNEHNSKNSASSFLEGEENLHTKYTVLPQILENIPEEFKKRTFTTIQVGNVREVFTYEQLYKKAKTVAANLQKIGLKKGDKLIFQIHDLRRFIETLWGCLFAGVISVPVDCPQTNDYKQNPNVLDRLGKIKGILDDPYICADFKLIDSLRESGISDKILFQNDLYDESCNYTEAAYDPEDTILLLFTSGSTGLPKGVKLCHRNVLCRSEATIINQKFNNNEVSLNWMPLTHVGGVVMFHILDTYNYAQQIHVETAEILQDPVLWLDLLSEFKVTNTWAPNFAYGLITQEKEKILKRDIDLSSVKFILNGGEAITFSSCDEFLKLLEKKNLRYSAMKPSWGMTETSSGVLFSDNFSKIIYNNSVAVGAPVPGTKIKITDPEGNIVPQGEIGELYCKGLTINKGYYNNEEANRNSFTEDGWFDTGDRAFIQDGEIVIAGRNKDIVVVNGVNYSCQDIEKEIAFVEGIDGGTNACMSIYDDKTGKDYVAIFYAKKSGFNENEVEKSISVRMLKSFGFTYDLIFGIKLEQFPRTNIGKLDKKNLKKNFEKEILEKQKKLFKTTNILNFAVLSLEQQEILEKREIPSEFVLVKEDLKQAELKELFKSVVQKLTNRSEFLQLVVIVNEKCLLKNFVKGFCVSLSREFSNLHSKFVSIDENSEVENIKNAEKFDKEASFNGSSVISYKNNKRFVQLLADFAEEDNGKNTLENKTCVVIGASGGVGRILSKYLITKHNCKIIGIGRSDLQKNPDRKAAFEELEKTGNFSYLQSELLEAEQAYELLENIYEKERFDLIFDLMHAEKEALQVDERQKLFNKSLEKEIEKSALFVRKNVNEGILKFIKEQKNKIQKVTFASAAGALGGKTYSVYSAVNCALFEDKNPEIENEDFVYEWSKWDGIGMSEGESKEERLISSENGYSLVEAKNGMESFYSLFVHNVKRALIGVDIHNPSIFRFRKTKQNFSEIQIDLTEIKDEKENSAEENDEFVIKMKEVWKRVLEISSIGINESFFDAGGNSLKSIKLIAEINEAYKTDLSIMELFRYPTVKMLCEYMNPKEQETVVIDI